MAERYRKRVEAELAEGSAGEPARASQGADATGGRTDERRAREAALSHGPAPSGGSHRAGRRPALVAARSQGAGGRARGRAAGARRRSTSSGRASSHTAPTTSRRCGQLATDPRATLRERALELLAIGKDPYAQELLVKGLEDPEDAIVSEAKAMQFLAYDDHAELTPLAQKVYKRSTGAAREEALRMLATDPSSERLFTRLLKDKSETSSIRRISASGLQSLNPAAFEKTARTIVTDDDDYDEIRGDQPRRPRPRPRGTREARGPEVRRGRAASRRDRPSRRHCARQASASSATARHDRSHGPRTLGRSRRSDRDGQTAAGRGPLASRAAPRGITAVRGPRNQRGGATPRLPPRELRERRPATRSRAVRARRARDGRHPYAVAGGGPRAARGVHDAARGARASSSTRSRVSAGNDDVVSFDDFAPEAAIEGRSRRSANWR